LEAGLSQVEVGETNLRRRLGTARLACVGAACLLFAR
jgi:hypothetical protein